MKKFLLVAFFFTLAFTAFSQQSNYQSKVYINGQPASGQHLIRFSIPDISWISPQKPVSINNGLFSTVIDFPNNLFDETHASREMIINLDGNNIDTVTIFAPIERDPTVKSYIRDSINWQDIHHKPAIDTVPQLLSINGDSLRISNGNYVLLPKPINTAPSTVINGTFTVIDTSIHQSMSFIGLGFNTCTGATDQSYWQSFQAIENGKLRQISLLVASSCMNYVTVYIYSGTGNSTQYLGYKSCPVTNVPSLQTLDLSSGVNSSTNGYITLETSKIYTFEIKPPAGCQVSVGCNSNNPYIDGISNISSNTDIAFALSMDKSAPSSLTIAKNGYVGIGTDQPTAQLEVNGRIKDQTGYLMPVGSVIAYAGGAIPEGWLLCDGRDLDRFKYTDLFKAIGTAWGTSDSLSFNLPDMRGLFLRGVDNSPTQGTTGRDPDRDVRIATASGGNVGNNVGSIQNDTFSNHTHFVVNNSSSPNATVTNTTTIAFRSVYGGNYDYILANTTSVATAGLSSPSGGSETRPQNVNVYYIIKD